MTDAPTPPPAQKPRRRRWPWVVLVIAIVVVAFGVDLAWAGVHAVGDLRQARDSLTAGGDALLSANLQQAGQEFGNAADKGDGATSALGHPSITVLGWMPWFHDEVDAARRAGRAIGLAAQGGTAYTEAAQAAGWDDTSIPGFAPGGRIDAGVLASAAPKISEAANLLGQAEQELAPVDPSKLQPPLDRLMTDAKKEIDERASQAEIAARLAGLLPGMLGADGPRDYLLAPLSPSDPRAAGGYPGVVGMIHVDGKRISLTHLGDTSEIPEAKPPVAGPAEAKKVWGWTGIDQFFWDTTYTPDFPTAAGFMARIWEASGRGKVDGVISADPSFMASLLQVVGPVNTPAWPETITAANVRRVVGADVYRTDSQAQSDAWETAVGASLWGSVLSRSWPLRPMANAMSESVSADHLWVWSPDKQEERELDALGVSGAFAPPTTTPDVRFNGFGANRVGYYVTTTTALRSNGGTTDFTVRIRNRATTGAPSILLGRDRSDVGGGPLGTFASDVNIYIPPGVKVKKFLVDGKNEVPFEWNELETHAVGWSIFVPPGSTKSITVSYG